MRQLKKLYVDFESYFNTKDGYTLREISMTEYIRDPRFKVFGCGYLYEGEYGWVRGEDMDGFKDLDWKNIEMIAHNVKFDGAIFAWRYGIRPAAYFDTQSLSRAILGQNLSSHSLKSVSEYLGLPPKGELQSDGLSSLSAQQEQEMMVYNRRDLECCAGIDEKIGAQFPDNQRAALDWTVRAFVTPTLSLDVPLLVNMVEKEQKKREGIFAKIGIEKSVFSSNKKFAELLEERKIEVPTKPSPSDPEKRIPAFSLSDPGFIALKESHPDLYEARVAAKSTITETRGLALANIGKSGPFPFDVQFSGAIGTHRYSGGSGAGGNPQNFPTKGDMRKAVRAPSGCSLAVGDFSSIEARLVAWLAKEPTLISAFLENQDVYSNFAETVYGHHVDKHNQPLERKVGKTCILGLGYGMGTDKFQFRIKQDAGIELPWRMNQDGSKNLHEARRIVQLYRTTYASIPALWKNAESLIAQMIEGYVNFVPFAPFIKTEKNAIVLPSGLRIQYPNLRWQPETEEWVYDVYVRKYDVSSAKLYGGKIIENICQALAGEICKIAIERAEAMGLNCVGQVHDEIIVVGKQDAIKKDGQNLQEAMEAPISWWPELRLGAEVHTGPNWQEAKG
jgi:DNA polymerase